MTDIEKRAVEIAEQLAPRPDTPDRDFGILRKFARDGARLALESLEAEVKKARREAIEDARKIYRTRGGDNSWDWFKEADEAIRSLIPKED